MEEEDFNELTAVPAATILIATNVNGKVRVSPQAIVSGSAGTGNESVRQLPPPLKLTASTTPTRPTTIAAPTKNLLQRQKATQQPQQQQQQQTSPTKTAAEKLLAQTSEESQPTELTPLVEAHDITLGHSPTALTPSSNTNTASSTQRSNSTAIVASVSPTVSVGLATATQFGGGLSPTTSTASIISAVGVANAPNIYGQQSIVPAAPTAPPPTAVAAAAAAAATTTTYSHNSKTTRSWPVIYRNPHHYDYEALYVQASSGNAKTAAGSNNHYHHQPPSQFQIGSSAFKQNCYSNQFAQSILYNSSNEDLSAINERGDGFGGATTGGSSNYGVSNGPSNHNTKNNTQTTCYYFAPSRHNSIYEHPSAVVHNSSFQFDPTAATTAAAAAAVESLRRSNSILLRNSSCAKALNQNGDGTGGGLDTPTSLNSAMDMGSGSVASGCCTNCCVGPPPVLFLFVTLLMTTSATAMLCAAIMTDHWEHVTWDRNSLDRYTNRSNMQLEWMLDDKVAMLKPDKKGRNEIAQIVYCV